MAIERGLKVQQYIGGFRLRLIDDNENPIGGFIPVGNTTDFEVKQEFETTEVPGNDIDNFGENIAIIDVKKPTSITMKNNTMTETMMAIALACQFAEQTAISAGNVTTEAHTAFNNSQIVLANTDVSNLVLTTPTAGTGTGYKIAGNHLAGETIINADTGSGTIIAGDTVTIGSHNYIVKTALSGGVFELKTGLLANVSDNADITVVAGKTLVLNTDYEIDPRYSHWVEIKAGVLGLGGAPLNAAYSFGSRTETVLTSGAQPALVEIVGDVLDRISGKPGILHIPKVRMLSNSVTKFITGKEVAAPEFALSCLTSELHGYNFQFTIRE